MKEIARLGKVLLISIPATLFILWILSLVVTPSKNIPPVSSVNPPVTTTPTGVVGTIKQPAISVTSIVTEKNITVSEPQDNQVVSSPLSVRGQARVFENVIHYILKDATGKVLSDQPVQYSSSDVGQFGTYSFVVNFTGQEGKKGTLYVFNYSAKDGSIENEVIVPVTFK